MGIGIAYGFQSGASNNNWQSIYMAVEMEKCQNT